MLNQATPTSRLGRLRRFDVLALLSLVAGTATGHEHLPAGAPLAPSVLLFHKLHHVDGPAQVARIAEAGFQRLQVVTTLHCRIDGRGQVRQLGRYPGRRFKPLDKADRDAFQHALTQTFQAAAERGMRVAVVAHLNSAGPVHQWRNNFVFDPRADYHGVSYEEAMMEPIANALAATPLARQEVDLALAGEMGRSLFAYPKSYAHLIDRLRQSGRLPRARLGVSVNFTHVAGEGQAPGGSNADAQALFDACDFLGMSNYRWFELPPSAQQFRQAVDATLAELRAHGAWWDQGKPVQFTEIGLGGGTPERRIAATPQLAARTPWEGFGRRQTNPWADAALARLRRDYHRALLEFLATQTDAPRVSAAYLWSEGSWDPVGTIDRGYEDPEIVESILNHNRRVAAGP